MDADTIGHATDIMVDKIISDDGINADIISLRCKDIESLINASKALYKMELTFRAILFVPRSYMLFNFDSIDAAAFLKDFKNDTSEKLLMVYDTDDIDSGDFQLQMQCKNQKYKMYRMSAFCNN